MQPQPNVIVIGAGAAGIIAALRASELGAQVTLLEKTPRVGTKILISGGGKCNITHAGSVEHVLKGFRPNEARFLRPSFYRLTNEHVIEMMTERGLRVYARPDGRIFPVDQTAKDVVWILQDLLRERGVSVRLDTPVTNLVCSQSQITGVQLSRDRILDCSHIVLAVGGSSYPSSGTTGDGWSWSRSLGHTIVKPRAALAPIYLRDDGVPFTEWSGVAIRDCVLRARQSSKEFAKWRGDLLFTHHGISGPNALGVSREVTENLEKGDVSLELDVAPDLPFEMLASQLLDIAQRHPKKLTASLVTPFVPERVAAQLLFSAEVQPDLLLARLEKRARNRLVGVLKSWKLGSVRVVPLEKGEVVAGGVSLDEVDPQTARSKIVKGLYLCGEVLDIAGDVGGYNLQAAFSTGYVAGESAAQDSLDS